MTLWRKRRWVRELGRGSALVKEALEEVEEQTRNERGSRRPALQEEKET